jgi:hypothetical protein
MLTPDLPKREPVDERIMPAFNRSGAIGRKFEKSTFADRLEPGKNGIGDGGCD